MRSGDRIAALDGIRGAAVMGILLMNIGAFAMPFAAYVNPVAYGPARWPDIAVWALEFVVVDGKMRAIFSALFGASLLLIAERTEAAGGNPARVHYARMMVLLLFGLAHACLLWDGDILVHYALIGSIAFLLRRLALERTLVLAGLLMLFQWVFLALHYQGVSALAAAASAPQANPAAIALWHQTLDTIGGASPATLAADLQLHRGAWSTLAASLAARAPGTIAAELLFNGPETLGLMLLGMAGLRTGLLTGEWTRASCLRLMRVAYLIGLPALGGIALLLIVLRFPPLLTAALDDLALPLRWLVASGHVALLVAWLSAGPSPLKIRIIAAGRAALTNYLGTSLIMTALFDGWGVGLYGHVERWLLLPFVLGTWMLMLAWSTVWLDHFTYGPLEWIWRLLARGTIPKFRRKAIAS